MKWGRAIAWTGLTAALTAASFVAGWFVGDIAAYDQYGWPVQRHAAQVNVYLLASAISNYQTRTGRWPCKRNGQPDNTFGDSGQEEVIRILLGMDPVDSVSNLSLLVIDVKALKGMRYIDPWGMPYFMAFDTDGDGQCKTARWGVLPGRGPFVWSEGGGAITLWGSNAPIIIRP